MGARRRPAREAEGGGETGGSGSGTTGQQHWVCQAGLLGGRPNPPAGRSTASLRSLGPMVLAREVVADQMGWDVS